jgi:hypothetical protein
MNSNKEERSGSGAEYILLVMMMKPRACPAAERG